MNPFQTHGAFSWPEYLASDVPSALKFYTQLLGLTTSEVPMPDGDTYTLLGSRSKHVAGLMACPPGAPPCWTYYVTVENIQKLLEDHDLNLIVPPKDIMVGTFAGFLDPQGAYLSVIQYAGEEQQEQDITDNQEAFALHGAFSWFELQTKDPKAAADWYSQLFGWSVTEQPMPSGTYYVFSANGTNVGGIMELVSPEIPSNWGGYVTVNDVDAVQAKAEELGATITAPAFDLPEVGRLMDLCDPAGAPIGFATWLPQ